MAKQLTKNQRIIAIVTVSVLLVYAFVNLGLAINSFIKLKNNITYLEDYAANWSSKTILDLQVVKGNSATCPTGYVSAFTDRSWPGTEAGCWCGSVSSSTLSRNNITCSPFCSGSCSSKASGVGCSNVAAKAGKTYNYVSQVQNSGTVSALVCVKKSDESLATNAEYAKSGSCPSGYTTCGSGEYLFCTKQSSCPIASLTPSSTTYDQTTKVNCLSANGCYVIADSGSGYVTSIQIAKLGAVNAYPVSQMTLNEYSMCNTEDETNKTPGRYLHYLLNTRVSGCGSEGQSLWNNLYTTNEKVLFDTNGIDVSSFSSYPDTAHGLGGGYYPTSETGTTYTYGLYNRGYLPWAAKCRDRLSTLVKNIDKVSQTKTAQTALLVVGVLSAAALGIGLSVMELMNLAGKDLPCISGKDEEERTKLKRIKKIIGYVFKGIQIPFQIWAIVICATIKGYFANIANDDCSNSTVNATMDYFAKTFQSTYSSNITSIAITFASILFDIVMSCCQKKKAGETAPQPASPSDEKAALTSNNMSQRKDIAEQPPQQFSPSYPQSNNNSMYTPQPQANINVNVQNGYQQQQQQPQTQYVQQQFIPQQQQVPPQQYANQQYPPQQYPNQYPPQQYPQQYPPQQMQGQPQQYPPQQFPNQYPPQQQPVVQESAKNDDYDPTAKFGRGQYY